MEVPPLAPATPSELVPVLLPPRGSATRDLQQDWVLWPINTNTQGGGGGGGDEGQGGGHDLADFAEGYVHDVVACAEEERVVEPPHAHLRGAVIDAVRTQLGEWAARMPPPAPVGAGPRRELIK